MPNGNWSCQTQEIPIPDSTFLDGNINTYTGMFMFSIFVSYLLVSALQCRLDCDIGYESQRVPVITCVDGRYRDFHPSTFVCQPAAVLLLSSTGSVEVFSGDKRCNRQLARFPQFGGTGRTMSLLDNEIVITGGDALGTRYTYLSILNPRQGLLAMKYSVENFPIQGSPHQHSSLGWGNQLLVIGGDHKSKAKLEKFSWNGIRLRWRNETKFSQMMSSSCSVKIARDLFLLIGGVKHLKERSLITNTVLKINTTSETVEEEAPMMHQRMKHSCEKHSPTSVLISGGINSVKNTMEDEIYNFLTGETSIVAGPSLHRYQHKLVRIEQRIFAFGGLNQDGSQSRTVMRFSSGTWMETNHQLFSEDTSNLAATSFPIASVDCESLCECGVPSIGAAKIFNGLEAEVKNLF